MAHLMNELLVVTTGGTIDKIYFDAKSDYQVGDPAIKDVLEGVGVAFSYEIISLTRKDSLEITEQDRSMMLEYLRSRPEKHILITHGTDTMVETASVLSGLDDRTIVLTGALNPASFRGSDAEFNIGGAVVAVATLPPGCYLVMNGKAWVWSEVVKDRSLGKFVARSQQANMELTGKI